MRLPARADEPLAAFLRVLPVVHAHAGNAGFVSDVLRRAELHGLAGIVHDALRANAVALPASLEDALTLRDAARELDHAAHLAMLGEVDRVLVDADIVAVALKGALLAERLYPRPASRPTGDIDLLVDESVLEAAGRALETIGYVPAEGPEEDRFRREHHHVHLAHPNALPLELHFHAYRGFGHILPSGPLLERRRSSPLPSMHAIGVLAPADELAYLAVHAAAHRFVRIGWLYDMKLLIETMTLDERRLAATRAQEWGFPRPLAFAAELLVDVLGVDPDTVATLGHLDSVRRAVVTAVVSEPAGPLRRSATRFVYTTTLCDTVSAAARYAVMASRGHARAFLRLPP